MRSLCTNAHKGDFVYGANRQGLLKKNYLAPMPKMCVFAVDIYVYHSFSVVW